MLHAAVGAWTVLTFATHRDASYNRISRRGDDTAVLAVGFVVDGSRLCHPSSHNPSLHTAKRDRAGSSQVT